MMLAVASPFLKQLFSLAGSDTVPAGAQDQEPLYIVLPEVKISLVQALLHFLYTGNVVTQEGQFYSLMKLVYALNINASIDAESTPNNPTQFKTKIAPNSELLTSQCPKCRCGDSKTANENNNNISFNKVSNDKTKTIRQRIITNYDRLPMDLLSTALQHLVLLSRKRWTRNLISCLS